MRYGVGVDRLVAIGPLHHKTEQIFLYLLDTYARLHRRLRPLQIPDAKSSPNVGVHKRNRDKGWMTGRHACHVGIKRVEVCGGKCISFVGGTFVFVFSLKDVQGGGEEKIQLPNQLEEYSTRIQRRLSGGIV